MKAVLESCCKPKSEFKGVLTASPYSCPPIKMDLKELPKGYLYGKQEQEPESEDEEFDDEFDDEEFDEEDFEEMDSQVEDDEDEDEMED